MMKRLTLVVLLLAAIAAGALYAFRDRLASAMIDRGLQRLQVAVRGRDVELSSLAYGKARFVGFGSLAADGVSGEIHLQRGLLDGMPETIAFHADTISATPTDVWQGRVLVTVLDGSLVILGPGGTPTGQQINNLRVEADLHLSWRHLADSVRLLEQELRHLAHEGTFRVPARIEGLARFQILGAWHDVTIRSQADKGVTSLHLDREGVRDIAKAYHLPLTEAEIGLVADNPVRAPALLRISQQAFAAAQVKRRQDRRFPYDAYRHVYWSWMLTLEFGPEFSEEVTDAHEIGPTYETTEASRRMDLHNNSVGRAYALAGVPERDLVQRVLTDPNVIRSESEVKP